MKLATALQIIDQIHPTVLPKGFRVSFEHREGHMLASDFFPDRDEAPIETEKEAWQLAAWFAEKAPVNFVNIYVVNAKTFLPVDGYRERMLRRFPNKEKQYA